MCSLESMAFAPLGGLSEEEYASGPDFDPQAWSDSDATDDDLDFDFDREPRRSKRLRVGVGTTSAVVDINADEEHDKQAAELRANTATLESVCLRFTPSSFRHLEVITDLPSALKDIFESIGMALGQNLQVLRIDGFPGCGDPVFGTHLEFTKRQKAEASDIFTWLATACRGTATKLRKLTLHGGHHSATSFCNFLAATTPPLEVFRCRGTLFHGRNFTPIVASMAQSFRCSQKLVEFETDAYIALQDPFGQLAEAFPNLELLRAARMYSHTPRETGLKRLCKLQIRKCKLAKDDRKLYGNFAIKGSSVHWFVTSDHHDDGYRGQGLWWDRLENTCECMETWTVGIGVTREIIESFMADCGIKVDSSLDEGDCTGDCSDSDVDPDDIDSVPNTVIQTTVKSSPDGAVELTATSLAGEEVTSATIAKDAPLLQWLEHVAAKLNCGALCVTVVLPHGITLDTARDSTRKLASLLPL